MYTQKHYIPVLNVLCKISDISHLVPKFNFVIYATVYVVYVPEHIQYLDNNTITLLITRSQIIIMRPLITDISGVW
jgi:hypothetical protein